MNDREKSGEIRSGQSLLDAHHDDDDDNIYIYIYIYKERERAKTPIRNKHFEIWT